MGQRRCRVFGKILAQGHGVMLRCGVKEGGCVVKLSDTAKLPEPNSSLPRLLLSPTPRHSTRRITV